MSYEAIAYVRRIGTKSEYEQKWLTVPTNNSADAIAAFRVLGFETRGISILSQSEATVAAQRI